MFADASDLLVFGSSFSGDKFPGDMRNKVKEVARRLSEISDEFSGLDFRSVSTVLIQDVHVQMDGTQA